MLTGTVTLKDLDEIFAHHPPESDMQKEQYHKVRKAGKEFAKTILENSPPSHDRNVAIDAVRTAVMRTNGAIALKGLI